MPLFRFHRGGLQDSLKTTVIVKTVLELADILRVSHKDWLSPNVTECEFRIEPYPEAGAEFDKRIGWYTQIVTSDVIEKGVFKPEGFLSEPF